MITEKGKGKPEKFDKKLNMDTATAEEVKKTNEELVNYLHDTGEDVAAEQVNYLRFQEELPGKKEKQNPFNQKILRTNNKILEVLRKIHQDMIDEQDTSIKAVSGPPVGGAISTSESTKESKEEEAEQDDESLDFMDRFRKKSKKGKKGKKGKGKARRTSKLQSGGKTKGKVKTPKKVSSGTLKKGAKLLGRVATRAVPILALGMAIYDGVQGWNKAGELLDLAEGEEATTGQKASAAIGNAISGLTFGLVDAKNTSKGINNLVGGNKVIEKYESMGIINHDTIGNSEIEDWEKLQQLKAKEIQDIINIDDWSNEDIEKLKRLKELAAVNEANLTKVENADTDKKVQETKKIVAETEMVKKVDYQIKSTSGLTGVDSTSKNPDDFKVKELFNLQDTEASAVEKLQPVILSNLKSMAAEYFDTYGEKIQINSAFRSVEEQKELKEQYGDKAAAPGKSMHNYGLAIDMNTVNAEKSIDAGLFNKYGFKRPVPGETWHVEPKNIDREAIRENGIKSTEAQKIAGDIKIESAQVEKEEVPETVPVKKVSTINVNPNIQNNIPTAPVEVADPTSNKETRETVVNNFNTNLTNQTVIYDTGTASQAMSQAIVPIIKQNINNTSTPEEPTRALNLFSS